MFEFNNALATRGMSRRSFVTGCAAGLAVLAAAGMVGMNAHHAARASESGKTITIECLGADHSTIEVEVPFDPQRIAVLDFAALDVLGALEVNDRIVGSAKARIEYLKNYLPEDCAELGNIKEADLEAVANCEPDVIFIGGRLARVYDDLAAIAPVIFLATDNELGLVESVRKNSTTIASIFGLEDKIAPKFDDFDTRVAAVKKVAEGHTAVLGLVTSGSFNGVGNNGRMSLITNECGFENVAVGTDLIKERKKGGHGGQGGQGGGNQGGQGGGNQGGQGGGNQGSEQAATDANSGSSKKGEGEGHEHHHHGEGEGENQGGENQGGENQGGGQAATNGSTNPHGEEASFETLVSLDPDYIFIMDRDQAIGREGAVFAQDVMNNELVNNMRCAKEGHIVYLENPGIWYTAEGGITALEMMFDDLYKGLGISAK